jgi:DNA invertase Pin-like site-specific DNA recombinase
MLTVLGGLAEFERELIKARTDEGRKRAQSRGVRFGRELKLTLHQRREAIARREAGEALADIGRSFGVSHSTISRLKAENERLHSSNRWLDQRVTRLRHQRVALAQNASPR